MSSYKPYEKYKNSEVEWLGYVPTHWTIRRLKTIISTLTDFTANGSFADLAKNVKYIDSVSYARLIRLTDLRVNLTNNGVYIDQNSYEYLSKSQLFGGEILIANVGAYSGYSFLVPMELPFRASLAPNMFLVKFNAIIVEPKFIHYALHSDYLLKQLVLKANATAQPKLNKNNVKECVCILPEKNEQITIARFLDYKTAQIDRFIRKKKQLIKLLNEQKAAIINHAVTKGINPDAPMKDSGIEWLGEIPAHWEVRKLKYIVSKTGTGVTPKGGATVYQSNGVPFLRSQNVHFSGLHLENVAFIKEEVHQEMIATEVRPNDVLLNVTGASIGRCCVIPPDLVKANVNQHVCIIRPKSEVDSKYLAAVISAAYIQRIIRFEQVGASREALNQFEIRNLPIIFPRLDEQQSIVKYILEETELINSIVSTINKEIVLAEEYRTALIAEAVTGKIDVREYKIPDAVEKEQAYEETEEELSLAAEDEVAYDTHEN